MADDVVSAFARLMAAEARELADDHASPADALKAVCSMLNRAANNPVAFLRVANQPPTQPERTPLPNPDDVYRRRREQVGGGR